MKVEIFDPAMCCETGVCGPSIDPEFMRISTVIKALKEKGIIIERHGLSSEPQAFVDNKIISNILQTEGAGALPVTLGDGEVIKTKEYPTTAELSTWLNIEIKAKVAEKKDGCGCGNKGCC